MTNTAMNTQINSAPSVVRMSAIVQGQVQGVGYRYWAHHAAQSLGLTGGLVRNLPDGTVEVQAEAESRQPLERLNEELRHGPTTAHVESVDAIWEENVPPRFSGGSLAVE